MPTIGVFSHAAEHTTARYFERCLQTMPQVQLRCLGAEMASAPLPRDLDLLLFVDPAPGVWPWGLEECEFPTAAYFIDVHQDLAVRLDLGRYFDIVFVAQKDYVEAFRQRGIVAHWLPLAAQPDVHHVPGLTRDIDVGFVGKLGVPGSPRHGCLSAVLGRFTCNDYQRFYSPQQMGAVYSRAKLVINASINGDVNMRVFEAIAAGALLITDRIGNGMDELLQEGVHYVGYASTAEALQKVDYYLQHDAERIALAARGQAHVLAAHTYALRTQAIVDATLPLAPIARAALLRRATRLERGRAYARLCVSLRWPLGIWRRIVDEGPRPHLLRAATEAWLRYVNTRVPLTPNALRVRFGRR